MPPAIVTDAEQEQRQRTGATLRTIRELRGWSMDQFSKQLDISYPYLANIEAGRKPLTNRLLARAAAVLDVPQIAISHPRAEHGTPTEAVPA